MNRKRKMKMTTTMLLLLLPLLFFQLREPIELPNILASGAGGAGDKQSFAVALVEKRNFVEHFETFPRNMHGIAMFIHASLGATCNGILSNFWYCCCFLQASERIAKHMFLDLFWHLHAALDLQAGPLRVLLFGIPKTYLYFNKTWALAIFSAPFKKKSK